MQSDVTEESDTASDAFCLSTSTSDTMFDLSSGGSNVALIARIEALEAEVQHLKKELGTVNSAAKPFRIEDIAANDSHIRFYTGFVSYEVLIEFFHFLGPSVYNLVYWGSSESKSGHTRKKKLDALNQFFLTLIKLRLNLQVKDLANRLTTWICLLYQHMKEIEWMPTPKQVESTLPVTFKQEYPTTYAIIDASKWFLETPSDLQMQSSTWSNYKHHNTAKYLIACTPNGSISYVSPLYVGSISDIELTRISGFLGKLEGKPGVAIMADRGFTIKDQLDPLKIKLNIPPFLEGRKQLPADEVRNGR